MTHASVLVIAAISEELAHLTDVIENPVVLQIGRRNMLSGFLAGIRIRLLVTGPGMANTVQALTAAIEDMAPELIIQTGCAGAFPSSHMKIGDIGIATREYDVHLGIEPEAEDMPLDNLPFYVIRREDCQIRNCYPLKSDVTDSAFRILRESSDLKGIEICRGPFVTVSAITATDKGAKRLYEQFHPYMESMEGAGAAHVAIHYEIPFLEIRAASNRVGKRDKTLWNLPLAFERGAAAVLAYIRGMSEQWQK